MARSRPIDTDESTVPTGLRRFVGNRLAELGGLALLALTLAVAASLASWSAQDPSLNHAVDGAPENWLGFTGAIAADVLMQIFGLGVVAVVAVPLSWATRLLAHEPPSRPLHRIATWLAGSILISGCLSLLPIPASWPLPTGLGGAGGDLVTSPFLFLIGLILGQSLAGFVTGLVMAPVGLVLACHGACVTTEAALRITRLFGDGVYEAAERLVGALSHLFLRASSLWRARAGALAPPARPSHGTSEDEADGGHEARARTAPAKRRFSLPGFGRVGHAVKDLLDDKDEADPIERIEPKLVARPGGAPQPEASEDDMADSGYAGGDLEDYAGHHGGDFGDDAGEMTEAPARVTRTDAPLKPGKRLKAEAQPSFPFASKKAFELPPLTLLAEPKQQRKTSDLSNDALEQNARMLEGVLEDFGVRGEIINVRPGPVVTLYELEPAPGIKSSRVIGLADDIARSMSAVSARVAVVPGRNVIGIELPNAKRETVYLRELMASEAFEKTNQDIALALGKNIGGEPVFADLARMPHLLIAGTTGSGKSVGINTMILSLLYRLPPDKCKLIMVDPKMLELSIYEGIPHLLAPVVTDPKKAVVALKWAVREMEDRYRKMSKLGVRNIDGYNTRVAQAQKKGEVLTRTVQTGYDPETGQPIYEAEEMPLEPMPYIVVIVDEMADLMMVAGKEIEGAIQRLAQMARAAGLHLITATQRPSVDVITGTIKANFPTRISFQVTSKIDSRTILGEQGAEQLLGQGDMLYMAGGGRITRLHGAFVSDDEVERIVQHLKAQAAPEYLQEVTEESDDGYQIPGVDMGDGASGGSGDGEDLYSQAVAVVARDRKASTSYIQRRLQIGYNRAASLIERMEQEGLISPANHAGKREVLLGETEDQDAG